MKTVGFHAISQKFQASNCAGEELFLVRGKQSGLWQLPGGMIEAMPVGLVSFYKFIMISEEKDPDSMQPFLSIL